MLLETAIVAILIVVGWTVYLVIQRIRRRSFRESIIQAQPLGPKAVIPHSELALWSVFPLFLFFVQVTGAYEGREVIQHVTRGLLVDWLGFSIILAIVLRLIITGHGSRTFVSDHPARVLEDELDKAHQKASLSERMVQGHIRDIWLHTMVFPKSGSSAVLERIMARQDEVGRMAREVVDRLHLQFPTDSELRGRFGSGWSIAAQVVLLTSLLLAAIGIAWF